MSKALLYSRSGLLNLRIKLVGKTLWNLEKLFFYPKLLKQLKLNNFLPQNLERELILFDVGANLGQTISFYRKNFSHLKIFAFEPLEDCFDYLNSNFSGQSNIYNTAISDINGVTPFFVSAFAETSTLVLPDYNSRWFALKNRVLGLKKENAYTKILVKTQTIDFFVKDKDIRIIDLLKIDVEGAELKVLYGCVVSFSEQIIKSIQVEVHHNDMRLEINLSIKDLLEENHFVRIASVRHAFGNFTDDLYVLTS